MLPMKTIENQIDTEKNYVKNANKRCLRYDLDREVVVSKRIIADSELNLRLIENRELMMTARPFIENLCDFVRGSNFFVILTDHEGCILGVAGDPEIVEKSRGLKMIPGAYMSEECIGTNAMGTAIAENQPVQISGDEHFINAYHTWTCSGAPIHDEDGNIIGALDLTGSSDAVHSHTLGMVVAAVSAIESIMKLNQKHRQLDKSKVLIESLFDSIKEGIVYADLEGNILSSNEQASRMFGYKKTAFENLDLRDLVEDWRSVLANCLTLEDYYNDEVMVHARANKVHFHLNAYKVHQHGEIHGIILMFSDVKKTRRLANKIMGRKAIYTFDKIIGESPKILETIEFAKKISDSKSTILISGESGCGKEVFAQAIQNYSPRKKEPFVAINCGAIPRNLIESELFGYEEGAFTGAKQGGQIGKFELADGGTIFLDEIGEMPLEMQTKLLRAIEEGTIARVGGSQEIPVDVRIIAATNKKLRDEVKKGNFRHDLYYRLNVIPLVIAPLREREIDIPLLANYFMRRISHRINKRPIEITDAQMAEMKKYTWPGNVRELENFIELAINKERMPIGQISAVKQELPTLQLETTSISLEEMEKLHIQRILQQEHYNMSNAAKTLGIGRNTLYRKVEKYEIPMIEE